MPKTIKDEFGNTYIIDDNVSEEEANSIIKQYSPQQTNPVYEALQRLTGQVSRWSQQYAPQQVNVPSPAGAIASGKWMDNLVRDLLVISEQEKQAQQKLTQGLSDEVNRGVLENTKISDLEKYRMEQAKQDRQFLQQLLFKKMEKDMFEREIEFKTTMMNQEFFNKLVIMQKEFEKQTAILQQQLANTLAQISSSASKEKELENLRTRNKAEILQLEALIRGYDNSVLSMNTLPNVNQPLNNIDINSSFPKVKSDASNIDIGQQQTPGQNLNITGNIIRQQENSGGAYIAKDLRVQHQDDTISSIMDFINNPDTNKSDVKELVRYVYDKFHQIQKSKGDNAQYDPQYIIELTKSGLEYIKGRRSNTEENK